MFLLYLKLAQKSLIKHKYYTGINVFGLVFGMLSALVIAKYIGGSLSFDRFHTKKDRVYAIEQEETVNGNPQKKSAVTYWGTGEFIHQYPEVLYSTRYSQHVGALIKTDGAQGPDKSFIENRIFVADSNFLKIFTFPLVYGNPETALSRVNSIVLTKPTAQKYFGNADPVGKTLVIRAPWGEETRYEVTGVAADIPSKSRFGFDFLVTPSQRNTDECWIVPDCSTYLLLKENANTAGLAGMLTNTVNEVTQLKWSKRKVALSLKSLAAVQLTNTEYLLAVVGIFIVLISWINYINQIIAQSYWRIRELGILRIMGATRTNLRIQFIVESSLVCLVALLLVAALYAGIEPFLQTFTNGHLLPLTGDHTPVNFLFLAIFTLGIALAAVIPSVVLFSQPFAAALRNGNNSKFQRVGLRKALVVFQFSISTVLMIGVFVVSGQLDYMRTKDKGVDLENTLVVRSPMGKDTTWDEKRRSLAVFKEKCAELPFVTGVSSSTTVPGEEYRQEVYLSFQDKTEQALVYMNGVDDRFFDLYGVTFLAGHGFVQDARWKNRRSIILNESAARALGISDFEKAIDAPIKDHESNTVCDLIGIVKDYHQTSLKYGIQPMAFRFNDVRGHFSIKMDGTGLPDRAFETRLGSIRQRWGQVYPDAVFDYFFLDKQFDSQDVEDQAFGKLFEGFTALSILISCLGLFGLSLLVSAKRQREVGVRKVFGASSVEILGVFLKSYLGSLCISVSIGAPLAYLLMETWLQDYAYRIDIGFWTIFFAVLCLTLIFLVTVSYHTIKSSVANPVTILKD